MNSLRLLKKTIVFVAGSCGAILSMTLLVVGEEVTIADRSASIQGVADVALPVRWHTIDSGNYKLETDLENLYIALYNTTNLPLQLIDDPAVAAQPVVNIYRQTGIQFGRTFSIKLDALACDLNPDVCNRNRIPADENAIQSALSHVGGYKASKGKWSQDGSVSIVVPSLTFEVGTAIIDAAFETGLLDEKSITALTSQSQEGVPEVDCSDWKRTCFEVIQRLNKAIFDPKRGGKSVNNTIKIPRTELLTNISLHELGKQGLSAKFNSPQYTKNLVTGNVNTNVGFTDAWRKLLVGRGAVELATEALSKNITSINLVEPQANHENFDDVDVPITVPSGDSTLEQPIVPVIESAAVDASKMEIFNLINHPFKNTDLPFPDYLKRPIDITVFDFAYDSEHCGLAENIVVDADLWPAHQPQLDRERATDCGTPSEEGANKAHDHGTHVLGVIASRFDENHMSGHNPFAKLRYVPLDQPAMRNAKYVKKIRGKIREISSDQDLDKTSIVNISWKYPQNFEGLDLMMRTIQESGEMMLFVVAAGNGGHNFSTVCSVQPACLHSFENVLTVVGLNRSQNKPEIWIEDSANGSNTHPGFGVGAIATDVTSTVFGGYVAPMSGTSQAAPQVAAAASLILSRFEDQFSVEQPRLLPIRVKNRLIYTSDLFPSMNGKLKGGRLNVLHALDMARARLTIDRDGALEHHSGNLLDVPPMGANPYIECVIGPESRKLQIRLRHLRRMEYDDARRKYVVFYQEQDASRDTPLTRINDCRLNTRYNVATFDSDEVNGELSFQLRNIRSYISPMF